MKKILKNATAHMNHAQEKVIVVNALLTIGQWENYLHAFSQKKLKKLMIDQ